MLSYHTSAIRAVVVSVSLQEQRSGVDGPEGGAGEEGGAALVVPAVDLGAVV